MPKESIFANVGLVQRGAIPTWRGWLLRDSPSAAKWRTTIDLWLANDDDPTRNEYRQRLLSEEGGRPAYNELVLRELLGHLFGEVEREPSDLPVHGKPDFAAPIGGQRTVLEVATLAPQLPEGHGRRLEIVERLKNIHGPWIVTPDWRSPGLMEATLPVIEKKVRDYLLTAKMEMHRADIDLGDNRRLWMGVAPGKRPDASIAILNFTMLANPGVAQIKREVKDKSGKYSPLKDAGVPFIVVFFAESPLVDEESLFDALYGQQTINVWFDEDQQVQSIEEGALAKGGKLMPKGAGGPYYTTVSAVWFVQELPWVDDKLVARIVELPNPWGKNPVDWDSPGVSKVRVQKTDDRVEFLPPESQQAFIVG